jgi:hypothetical protein
VLRLPKIGIAFGETSVSKYLVRQPEATVPNLENLSWQSRQ